LKTKIFFSQPSNHPRYQSVDIEYLRNFKSIYKKMYSLGLDCDYYVLHIDKSFAIIGYLKTQENFRCIVDLVNDGVGFGDFFKFVNNTLDLYDSVYCVPNKLGARVFGGIFKFNQTPLSLRISFTKFSYQNFRFRYFKYLFINYLFKLKPTNSFSFLNRKLFYNNRIPPKIIIDTF